MTGGPVGQVAGTAGGQPGCLRLIRSDELSSATAQASGMARATQEAIVVNVGNL